MMDTESRVASDPVGALTARAQIDWICQLQAIRILRGLNVDQAADLMGVDSAQVYRFGSGDGNVTMATVHRYSTAVGAVWTIGAAAGSNAEVG